LVKVASKQPIDGMGFLAAGLAELPSFERYRALQISENAPNVAKWCRRCPSAFSYDQKYVDPQIGTRESPA
jgi:hypothetical protein